MVEKWPFLKLEFSIFFLPKLKNIPVKQFHDLCHKFWSNWDLDMFSPSKWPSAPKFWERYICRWWKMARNGCKIAKRKSCLLFKFPVFKTELLETGYQKSGGGADYAHPITTPLIYLPKNGGDETHVLKRSGAPDKWKLWKSSGKSRYVCTAGGIHNKKTGKLLKSVPRILFFYQGHKNLTKSY